MDISTYARNRVEWFYQLARCLDVSHSTVRVGFILGTFLNEDRPEVKPGYVWIQKTAGVSRATAVKAIRELSDQGFIDVTDFGGDQKLRIGFPFDGDAVWNRMVQKLNQPS